jgi:hypothetical protein
MKFLEKKTCQQHVNQRFHLCVISMIFATVFIFAKILTFLKVKICIRQEYLREAV